MKSSGLKLEMGKAKVTVFLNFMGILWLLHWGFIEGMNLFLCSEVY